jgi:hypothetical protein
MSTYIESAYDTIARNWSVERTPHVDNFIREDIVKWGVDMAIQRSYTFRIERERVAQGHRVRS